MRKKIGICIGAIVIIAVIAAFELVLAGAVARGYAGFPPLEITVVAIVESVVSYYHVTYTCLFEPVVSVAFEKYCCAGYVEVAILDNCLCA